MSAACGGDDNDASPTVPFSDEPTPIEGISTIAAYPLDVPRSDGKTLTLNAPPQRIVSLSPGATEIIYALGAQGALAAVDNQADYPPEVASLSARVDAFEPNVEAIAGMNPDLVIVANNASGIVEALDRLNIPVYYQDIDTDITTIEAVFGQIILLGAVTGKSEAAQTLVVSLGDRVQKIRDGVQGVNTTTSPKVFHELDSTLFTVSTESFIGDLYKTLRAQNIAGDGGGQAYPQMTNEAVIASAPEVIILGDEEFGVTVESVKARPGWDTIPAVQNDRIHGLDPDIISRPGPRIVDALEQLAKLIYPERFE
jgi:iron complex transport system substrate-binding protein